MHELVVIANPNSGTASSAAAARAVLEGRADWVEAADAAMARELARDAARAGARVVVAAGGDGTLHAIVAGLAEADFAAALGVLPLGTGNDFARSLGLPRDPEAAARWLARDGALEAARAVDLMRADFVGPGPGELRFTRWGINVAAGGFPGQVDEVVTEDLKSRWGPLAYLRGAAQVLPDLTGYDTVLASPELEAGEERVRAVAVLVANGRTCAGGLKVAPDAVVDDGLLDVAIVLHGSALDLAAVAAMLVAGAVTSSRDVFARRVRSVRIESAPPMAWNVDGELYGESPIAFTAVPGALRVLAGDDAPALSSYSPPPAPSSAESESEHA